MGNPRQALETDMVAVVQIGQQCADTRAKRRARLHRGGGLCAITGTATLAAAAEQFHPRHDRPDRRQVDVVIAVTATLCMARNIGAAMAASAGDHALGLVRRLGQRSRLAFARRTLANWRFIPLFDLAPANAIL